MSENPESESFRVAHLYQRTFRQGPLHGGVLRAQRVYLRTLRTHLKRLLRSPTPTQEPTNPPSSCEPAYANA